MSEDQSCPDPFERQSGEKFGALDVGSGAESVVRGHFRVVTLLVLYAMVCILAALVTIFVQTSETHQLYIKFALGEYRGGIAGAFVFSATTAIWATVKFDTKYR